MHKNTFPAIKSLISFRIPRNYSRTLELCVLIGSRERIVRIYRLSIESPTIYFPTPGQCISVYGSHDNPNYNVNF